MTAAGDKGPGDLRPGRINATAADGIGWIELDNPARLNAISVSMWHEADNALAAFAADPAIRCVVFAGAGTRAFCAGADVAEKQRHLAAPPSAPAEQKDRTALAVLRAIGDFPKPTIAMIRGHCLGAGMAIAITCDLRFADLDARFAIPAARLGLPYYFGGLCGLVDLVGASNAKRILFTADRFDTAQALRFGLIDEAMPGANLECAVRDLARRIAANAPLTIAAAKHGVAQALRAPQERDPAAIAAHERACLESRDYQEGVRAFLEKRPPAFHGV